MENSVLKIISDTVNQSIPDTKVDIVTINKGGGDLDFLKTSLYNGEIYIFVLDEDFSGLDKEDKAKNFAASVVKRLKAALNDSELYEDIDSLYDELTQNYDSAKSNIVIDVIPKKGNEEFLKDVPYETYMENMAVICKIIVCNPKDIETTEYIPTAIVNNKLLQKLNITFKDMYENAIQNSTHINYPVVLTASDVLFPDVVGPTPWGKRENSEYLIPILTTQTGVCGASAIMDKKSIRLIERIFRENDYSGAGDFYIIPCQNLSIIVPTDMSDLVQSIVKALQIQSRTDSTLQPIGELLHYSHATHQIQLNSEYEEFLKREYNEIPLQTQRLPEIRERH